LHRPRRWDEVVLVEVATTPPHPNDGTVSFVVLPDGSTVLEAGSGSEIVERAVAALGLTPPYRAEAVRREDGLWAVGARRIEVVELRDVPGNEVEVVWDGSERSLRIDGEPTLRSVPELVQHAASRFDSWVARAYRIDDGLWEVEVEPL
jgi:hypothetical protein